MRHGKLDKTVFIINISANKRHIGTNLYIYSTAADVFKSLISGF